MNIQELIDLLNTVPDKSKTIYFEGSSSKYNSSYRTVYNPSIEVVTRINARSNFNLGDVILGLGDEADEN